MPSVSTDPVPEPVPDARPSVSSGSSDDKSGNSDVNLAPKVASESIKSDPHIPPFMDIARPSPFRQGGEGWSIAPENPRWSNVVQPQDDSPVTPEHQASENRRRSARLKAGIGAGGARHGATLAQTPRELVRAGVSLGIILNQGSELCNHPDSECLDVPIGIPQEEVDPKNPQSKQKGKTQKFEHFDGFINNFNFLKVNFGKRRPIGRTSLLRI